MVRETSRMKIKDSLVRLDLNRCIYPKRLACKSGLEGARHTRSDTQYYIVRKVCRAKNILAEYHRESGSTAGAIYRLSEHETAIINKNSSTSLGGFVWMREEEEGKYYRYHKDRTQNKNGKIQ